MKWSLNLGSDPVISFGFLLKDVARLHTRNFECHAKTLGWTMPQCRALAELARNEGSTQIQLAELAETDPMTLVRLLDKMERDGWIERRLDSSDRRVRRLYLKPEAAPILEKIHELADLSRKEALAEVSPANLNQLIDTLRHIHLNLTRLAAGRSAPEPVAQDRSSAFAISTEPVVPRRRLSKRTAAR